MSIMPKGELFTTKMLALYTEAVPILEQVVENDAAGMYNPDLEEHQYYCEALRIYRMSESLKDRDSEIAEALYATALWYIHYYLMNSNRPETFVELDDNNREYLNYDRIAEYLIKKYCVVSANGQIFMFIGSKYYSDADRLRKDIVKLLHTDNFSESRKIEQIVRDILFRVRHANTKFDYPFNKKAKFLVPVKNGVVVRRNLNCLLPKSPVWGFTYSLPIDYDPDAPTEPVMDFIRSLVAPEDVEILIQIGAQALLQDENYQTAYLLTGDGANGKSTYLNFLLRIIGKENTTAVSIQDLVEDKFKAAELQGKLMNVYADLPKTSIKTTGKFKILTGGDQVTVERKFAQPFTMVNRAVFVFSANELPEINDGTYAFWRRWEVIEFKNTFPKNPGFIERLMTPTNFSGMLDIILDKMARVEEEGLTESNKIDQIKMLWMSRSNSAYAYVAQRLVRDPQGYIEKDRAYNVLYTNFCAENEFTPVTKTKFTQEIEKFGGISTMMVIDQVRRRIYKGVRDTIDSIDDALIPDDPASPEPAPPAQPAPGLDAFMEEKK
jgi:putative DNA primase/helicase